MDKNRRIISVLLVLGLIFTIMGGTIAYYNWQTTEEQKTLVSFTVSNNFSCSADGGGNITDGDVRIIPTEVNDSTVGNYIKREVKVYPKPMISGISIYMDLWLDINEIGSGLSNSDNFKYAFTTGSTSPNDGVVSTGNFKDKLARDKIKLLSNKEYSSKITNTFYLWIWLDAAETSPTTMNQTFSLSLNGVCVDSTYESINLTDNIVIDLPKGLIPITLDNDGTVKTTSKNSTWANYNNNKQWANAVLVKESGNNTRDYYNSNIGVVVSEDDILAYYVYIPRYKYKIWTTSLSSKGSEQEIETVFETKNTAKSTGTQVGEYITHPGFTFGDKEMNGIWVGKFETGGTDTNPLIKPNIQSLREQTVSAQFTTAQLFGSSIYGLTTNIDPHMMKNNEWGAVAYLSHSKYGRCTDGICEEVMRNNNSNHYTGYGAVKVATSGWSETSSSTNEFGTSSSITQPYNTEVGYKASTTGNIYGIYDMSGGAWDRVMGVLADGNDNPRSGNSTTYNSGYNGMVGNGTMYKAGVDFPDSKYYNLYTSTNSSSSSSSLSLTACNGGVCYGHGLSEVSNWYSDYAVFVFASSPWVERGGQFNDGISTGAFSFYDNYGDAGSNVAARSVLLLDSK